MASLNQACGISKCEIYSCATCHCCKQNLCLDHLKQHKDQLNDKLTPLVHDINTLSDQLGHVTPNDSPAREALETWRIQAYQTVDNFCELMRQELFNEKRTKLQQQLQQTHGTLTLLFQKQGATNENIGQLIQTINSIRQALNELTNIQINLKPLSIDKTAIVQPNNPNTSKTKGQKRGPPDNDLVALQNGTAFQIFIDGPNEQYTYTVKPFESILQLKDQINQRTGIPIKAIKLYWMGKLLQDGFTIANTDIQKNSTIHLDLRTTRSS